MDSAPKVMSLHLLEEITDGFSKDRKLGGGAYGNVYLGEYKDGEKIAVKVLKDVISFDDEEFEKEYHNLASLRHKNVVRLVGYCNETKREYVQHSGRYVLAEKTKRALCFEYMPNGSLDKFISDGSNGHDWPTRYAIIKGLCNGLEYLHEKLESPMCHLDLKPANVLLDENMTPKIADFGLSRLFGGDKTQITKSPLGTYGYVPPEYIDAAVISVKFDIFSLGVTIIKLMTGRDGYFRIAEISSQQFVELVHMDWRNRLQAISVHIYSVQVRRCIEIALSCVEADRHKRPSIGVIVNTLNKMESCIQILDALRNESASSINQLCPCITIETEMLDVLKNKLISYPLRITDNRGAVHEATITTIADPAGDTSTSEPVRPRIKIIRHEEGLSEAMRIDADSTEPWILVVHIHGEVSIWNVQNQWQQSISMDVDCPQMKRCIEIAQICVDGDQHNRPTIGEIIRMLNEAETMIHKVPAVISESTNDPGSSVYQASSSVSKLVDEVQSMAVSAAPSHSQLQQIMSVPKGPGETSTEPFKDRLLKDESNVASNVGNLSMANAQSGPVTPQSQGTEYSLNLYMHQTIHGPNHNQINIADPKQPMLFGYTNVHDYPIHDGLGPSAKIVARAQGLHAETSMNGDDWFHWSSIVFIDERFRGSSFKAIGNQNKIEGEWAIVGGTGVFTFAQGTISIYRIQDNEPSNIKEIRINAFCYTPPQATATETKAIPPVQ